VAADRLGDLYLAQSTLVRYELCLTQKVGGYTQAPSFRLGSRPFAHQVSLRPL
jgi:hypothetical protein